MTQPKGSSVQRWAMRGAVRILLPLVAAAFSLASVTPLAAGAEKCEDVVLQLNQKLDPKIDEYELTTALDTLNATNNKKLPPKFVTKSQAKKMGWRPGKNLWAYKKLKGKSIGGDVFTNSEGTLPNGTRKWHEADLDYKGGHRGAKRLLYSNDGMRMVTVDHYNTFTEVPACQ